jgi:hypothetical protein
MKKIKRFSHRSKTTMSDKEERITGIGTYTIVGRAQRLGSERWS